MTETTFTPGQDQYVPTYHSEWALVEDEPYASWISQGIKLTHVDVKEFSPEHIGRPLVLVGDHAYGRITLGSPRKISAQEFATLRSEHRIDVAKQQEYARENAAWYSGPYWAYPIKFAAFPTPLPYKLKEEKVEKMCPQLKEIEKLPQGETRDVTEELPAGRPDERCPKCGKSPCVCEKKAACPKCGKEPCVCTEKYDEPNLTSRVAPAANTPALEPCPECHKSPCVCKETCPKCGKKPCECKTEPQREALATLPSEFGNNGGIDFRMSTKSEEPEILLKPKGPWGDGFKDCESYVREHYPNVKDPAKYCAGIYQNQKDGVKKSAPVFLERPTAYDVVLHEVPEGWTTHESPNGDGRGITTYMFHTDGELIETRVHKISFSKDTCPCAIAKLNFDAHSEWFGLAYYPFGFTTYTNIDKKK